MHYNAIAASIPSLFAFLEALRTGQLGGTLGSFAPSTFKSRSQSKQSSGSKQNSNKSRANERSAQDALDREAMERITSGLNYGIQPTMVVTAEGAVTREASIRSANSEEAIMVRQTVDVRYSHV